MGKRDYARESDAMVDGEALQRERWEDDIVVERVYIGL